jgi:hypothetical protein
MGRRTLVRLGQLCAVGLLATVATSGIWGAFAGVARIEAATCSAFQCPDGDAACGATQLDAFVACLRGAGPNGLPECPGCRSPSEDTTVFRATGSGLILYGTVGGVGAAHAPFLRGAARLIERGP